MLTPHGHTFTVEIRGQKWRGTWKIDGKDLCVASAYGSDRRPLGRRKAALVAAEALEHLVDAWARRQA